MNFFKSPYTGAVTGLIIATTGVLDTNHKIVYDIRNGTTFDLMTATITSYDTDFKQIKFNKSLSVKKGDEIIVGVYFPEGDRIDEQGKLIDQPYDAVVLAGGTDRMFPPPAMTVIFNVCKT